MLALILMGVLGTAMDGRWLLEHCEAPGMSSRMAVCHAFILGTLSGVATARTAFEVRGVQTPKLYCAPEVDAEVLRAATLKWLRANREKHDVEAGGAVVLAMAMEYPCVVDLPPAGGGGFNGWTDGPPEGWDRIFRDGFEG
jgi:hypothetical protein